MNSIVNDNKDDNPSIIKIENKIEIINSRISSIENQLIDIKIQLPNIINNVSKNSDTIEELRYKIHEIELSIDQLNNEWNNLNNLIEKLENLGIDHALRLKSIDSINNDYLKTLSEVKSQLRDLADKIKDFEKKSNTSGFLTKEIFLKILVSVVSSILIVFISLLLATFSEKIANFFLFISSLFKK